MIVAQILNTGWTGKSGRSRRQLLIRRLLEPVLHEQAQIVPLIEDLALDLGVNLPQATHLAVLLGDQLLAHRRDLDVQIVIGEIEVRSEELCRCAVGGELDRKLARFVFPFDLVEIEQSRKLPLALVCEIDLLCLGRLFG